MYLGVCMSMYVYVSVCMCVCVCVSVCLSVCLSLSLSLSVQPFITLSVINSVLSIRRKKFEKDLLIQSWRIAYDDIEMMHRRGASCTDLSVGTLFM